LTYIGPLSAIAAGIVILIIVFCVAFSVGLVCYLAITTWLKTRHIKITEENNK
jgi:hypothetical protein